MNTSINESERMNLLNKICRQCNLGNLETSPVPLTGGFMHKMYSLFTDQRKYAVKLLNPFVMQRNTALANCQTAERLEAILEENDLPIIPALTCGGQKTRNIDGKFFYLYQWYDGRALKPKEVSQMHCAKIGGLLAQIHTIDRKESTSIPRELHIDWDSYISLMPQKNKELYALLKDTRPLLYESQEKGNIASAKLPPVLSICHNDMDCKNVLWIGSDCRIIDLECLSYANPLMELYETALCWSGYEEYNIDCNLLSCFVNSYAESGGELPTDWEILYDCSTGRLEWLEYNVKRSLGIECSEEEIELGISEVKNTLKHVIYYHTAKNDIINCLNQTKH